MDHGQDVERDVQGLGRWRKVRYMASDVGDLHKGVHTSVGVHTSETHLSLP